VSQPITDGIGRRIARYRKLNRWSARQLAENTDGAVSRDTIANLENGRRTDMTVRQFLAIALALRVPPAALLTDLEHPLEPTDLRFPGRAPAPLDSAAPAITVTAWLNGQAGDDTTPAARWVNQVTGLLAEYLATLDSSEASDALDRIDPSRTRHLDDATRRRRSLRAELIAAGVHIPDPDPDQTETHDSGGHAPQGRARAATR
jgi:transcriptional regulator with XRE-family HTH domain